MAEFLSARVARLQADLDRAKQELRLQEADPEATQYDGPFWKGQWAFACREAANARARAEETEAEVERVEGWIHDHLRPHERCPICTRSGIPGLNIPERITGEEVADAIRACDEIALILKTDLDDLVEALRKLEWRKAENVALSEGWCPACHGDHPTHREGCWLHTLLDRMDKGTKGQLTRFDLEKMIEQREGTILKQQEMLLAHPAVEGLRTALNGIPDEKTLKRLQAILKELEPEELRQVRGH